MTSTHRGRFPGWRAERADWVVAGWTNPDGSVCLVASTKLADNPGMFAEVQHRQREYHFRDFAEMRAYFKPEYTLSVHMKDFLVIEAPDYPAAMAALFRQWRPEQAQRQTLPAGFSPPTPPAGEAAEREARQIAAAEDIVDAIVVDDEPHPSWCAHRFPHPGHECSALHRLDCDCKPPDERTRLDIP